MNLKEMKQQLGLEIEAESPDLGDSISFDVNMLEMQPQRTSKKIEPKVAARPSRILSASEFKKFSDFRNQ